MNLCRLLLMLFICSLLLNTGCANKNNHLQPQDFAARMRQDGLPVGYVKPLNPAPIGASQAAEIRVGNSSIGVYKFDRNNRATAPRLERIAETGKVHFNGIPYPIYEVSGSFVIVGLDKNSEKYRILKSFRKFR